LDLHEEVIDGVGVVRVDGEVDALAAPDLSKALARVLGSDGIRSLVVDCEGVSFMDSTGLSALLEAQQTAEPRFVTVAVRRPSEFIARLLRISGLDDVLVIEDGPGGGSK
jgi:anti-sigma B factor antagonist